MLSPVPDLMSLLDILTFSLVLIGCCFLFQLLLQCLWLCSERLHQLPGSHQWEETWVHIGEVTVMINKLSYYTCVCVTLYNTGFVCVCVCEQIRGTWGCRCELSAHLWIRWRNVLRWTRRRWRRSRRSTILRSAWRSCGRRWGGRGHAASWTRSDDALECCVFKISYWNVSCFFFFPQEEKAKAYKKEKQKERKRRAEDDVDFEEDDEMAAVMGFSGFGSSKKSHWRSAAQHHHEDHHAPGQETGLSSDTLRQLELRIRMRQ